MEAGALVCQEGRIGGPGFRTPASTGTPHNDITRRLPTGYAVRNMSADQVGAVRGHRLAFHQRHLLVGQASHTLGSAGLDQLRFH
jgi:hypothetical protein